MIGHVGKVPGRAGLVSSLQIVRVLGVWCGLVDIGWVARAGMNCYGCGFPVNDVLITCPLALRLPFCTDAKLSSSRDAN